MYTKDLRNIWCEQVVNNSPNFRTMFGITVYMHYISYAKMLFFLGTYSLRTLKERIKVEIWDSLLSRVRNFKKYESPCFRESAPFYSSLWLIITILVNLYWTTSFKKRIEIWFFHMIHSYPKTKFIF